MKKAILSTLCSGLVIPGLGQVINQQLKKGMCILSLVFILFIATLIKMYMVACELFRAEDVDPSNSKSIMQKLEAADLSLLWYLLSAFALIWLYSVLDAYLTGKKIDQLGQGDHL